MRWTRLTRPSVSKKNPYLRLKWQTQLAHGTAPRVEKSSKVRVHVLFASYAMTKGGALRELRRKHGLNPQCVSCELLSETLCPPDTCRSGLSPKSH